MEIKERNSLIIRYMPLADKIAKKKRLQLSSIIQLDELKSAAYLGLIDAANKYDKTRKVAFPIYARMRIVGEIEDYLREASWGKRNVHIYTVSLDMPTPYNKGGKPSTLAEYLVNKRSSDAGYEDFFATITRSLPYRIKKIIYLYYAKERTMKQIAEELGVSESRISQLLSQYKIVLKNIWKNQEKELYSSIDVKLSQSESNTAFLRRRRIE